VTAGAGAAGAQAAFPSQNPFALLVDTEAMEWDETGGGNAIKVLWASEETGAWTALIKSAAGQVNAPHVHLGPANFLVLSGAIEYRGGFARTGSYIYEPVGAVHDATTTPDETIYLSNVFGPLAFLDAAGKVSHVSSGEHMLRRFVELHGQR
jgi:anti-sigma factor ChrR (cupin superfamily)